MQVKLNNTYYDLYSINGNGSTLTMRLMNVSSIDKVQEHASMTKSVYVYDDSKVVNVYEGYTILTSVNRDVRSGHVIVVYKQEYDDAKALNIIVGERPNVERAKEFRANIEELANFADDETASKNTWAYAEWSGGGVTYEVGDKVVFDTNLYKCLQAHTSQETWSPSDAPSLWAKIINEEPSGDYPVWEQPTSTNPYMHGDRVYYPTKDNQLYESVIDDNIWSPSDYPQGWKEVE